MSIRRRSPRRSFLAAPLVVTAVLTPACGGRTHTNPSPPEEPTAAPVDTAAPDADPTAGPLAEIPNEEGGKVVKQPDGTCLYVFPPPDMSCPPGMSCNPGPPRTPVAVKCPPDGQKAP